MNPAEMRQACVHMFRRPYKKRRKSFVRVKGWERWSTITAIFLADPVTNAFQGKFWGAPNKKFNGYRVQGKIWGGLLFDRSVDNDEFRGSADNLYGVDVIAVAFCDAIARVFGNTPRLQNIEDVLLFFRTYGYNVLVGSVPDPVAWDKIVREVEARRAASRADWERPDNPFRLAIEAARRGAHRPTEDTV